MSDDANKGELPPAQIESSPIERDTNGRFLAGNSGGGRKKGARNKLTENLLSTVADDFAEHGAAALAKLRGDDPAGYFNVIARIVPRELILQQAREPNFASMSDDEAYEYLESIERAAKLQTAAKSLSGKQ